jgi:hypothetical protein
VQRELYENFNRKTHETHGAAWCAAKARKLDDAAYIAQRKSRRAVAAAQLPPRNSRRAAAPAHRANSITPNQ